MRYALALVLACCALAVTPFALADDGQSSSPVPDPACSTRADLEKAFAHKRWRVEHPARSIRCLDAELAPYAKQLKHGFYRYADRQFRACSPRDCKLYARRLIGRSQFRCLDALWGRESGWRRWAANPISSAHGIPQALPGSKMGPGWQSDGKVQIRWGLDYIESRYGSPCAADGYQAANNYY